MINSLENTDLFNEDINKTGKNKTGKNKIGEDIKDFIKKICEESEKKENKKNNGENKKNNWEEKKLEENILKGNIIPFFQKIVDKNGEKVFFEALARLKINEKFLSPIEFLPFFKTNSKIMKKITLDILEKSFEKNLEKISINIGEKQLLDNDIFEKIIENKDFIIIEVLEDEILNEKEFIERIKILKDEGIEIAIDDFGKGYSNVDRVIKFEPNFVKINGTMIKNFDFFDDEEKDFIKELIKRAQKKGIKIVAEFIENKDIFKKLKEIGIDLFQGYYFSEPSYEKK